MAKSSASHPLIPSLPCYFGNPAEFGTQTIVSGKHIEEEASGDRVLNIARQSLRCSAPVLFFFAEIFGR